MQAAETVPCIFFFVYCPRHHLTNHGHNHTALAKPDSMAMIARTIHCFFLLIRRYLSVDQFRNDAKVDDNNILHYRVFMLVDNRSNLLYFILALLESSFAYTLSYVYELSVAQVWDQLIDYL